PVERGGPLQRAVLAQVLAVIADQVQALGASVGTVDEVLAAGGGRDAIALQHLGDFRAKQGAGEGDAVTHVDHGGGGGEGQAIGGREGEPQAEGGRALRLQLLRAECLGGGRTHEEYAVVDRLVNPVDHAVG